MVWFDQAENADMVAVAEYFGEIKLRERCWQPGPFDELNDALRAGLRTLDRQLTLWQDGL